MLHSLPCSNYNNNTNLVNPSNINNNCKIIKPKSKIVLYLLTFILLIFIVLSNTAISQEWKKDLAFWGVIKGPATQEIMTIKIASNDDIYLGMWGTGILKSTTNGTKWAQLNTGLNDKFITNIVTDQEGSVYAASFGGGVFRMNNSATTWTEINNGLTNKFVKALTCDENGKIYAGTYGSGVFVTTDKGQNWKPINEKMRYKDINVLTATRNRGILAGTSGDGIIRYDLDEKTWKRVNAGLYSKVITSFTINNLGEIYAGTLGGGVYYSVDDGRSWSQYFSSTTPLSITTINLISGDQPIVGTADSGIFRFDMVSETWMRTSIIWGGANIIVKNSQGHFFASQPYGGVIQSTNAGRNWANIGLRVDTGIKPVISSKNGLLLAYSNDGDLSRSFDYGKNWSLCGLPGKQILSLAIDSSDNIYAGTADGIYVSSDLGDNFNMLGLGGRGIKTIGINKLGHIFAADSEIYRSTNSGMNWVKLNAKDVTFGKFIGINKNNDIYFKFAIEKQQTLNGLCKSTSNGDSWQYTNVPLSTAPQNVAFSSQGYIYAATDYGLYISTNNGTAWTLHTFDYVNMSPYILFVATTPKNHIFNALYGNKHIIHSSNNGTKWDSASIGIIRERIEGMVTDQDGFIYLAMNCLYRGVEPESLIPPVPIGPTNNVDGIEKLPTISWRTAPKADLYELQISEDIDFINVLETVVQSDTTYKLQYPIDNGKMYVWRVRSKVNASYSKWSPLNFFRTIFPAPDLISPNNNSTGLNKNITFLWNKVTDVPYYRIQVSEDASFNNAIIDKTNISDTTTESSIFQNYKTYFWKVRAESSTNIGDWSETWKFRTKLNAPKLIAPDSGIYGLLKNIKLEWLKSEGATKYIVLLSKQNDFSTIIFTDTTDKLYSYIDLELDYFSEYYWKVKAIEDQGESDWSVIWMFKTVINAPELVSPRNTAVDILTNITFRWTKYNYANFYHFQLSKSDDFSTLIENDSNVYDPSFEIRNLEYFTTYHWRVRIKNFTTYGLWSNTWAFTTGLATPILTYPKNEATEIPPDLYIKWEPLKGADYYQLQISKSDLFDSLIVDEDLINNTEFLVNGLENETKYYWRVKGKYSQGVSEWSEVWHFETRKVNNVFDVDNNFKISIHPNPFNEFVTFNIFAEGITDIKIDILDLYGRLIDSYNSQNVGESKVLNWIWKPTSITQGIYFYKINLNGYSYYGKVIYTE